MPEEPSIEALLKIVFEKSIQLGNYPYTPAEIAANWIGDEPASQAAIAQKEKALQLSLPEDYKALLQVTNGFKTSDDAEEPSFLPVEEVDYLQAVFPELIEGYEDTLPALRDSILVAGKLEEQQFLLIPPKGERKEWQYWKFANWIPGEEEYTDIKGYSETLISSLSEEA